MRKPKLYLGLILAITLFASAVPAAASHPTPFTAVAGGTGRVSEGPLPYPGPVSTPVTTEASPQTHEMVFGSDACASNTDGSPSADDPAVRCNLWMDGIHLTPVNGVGPNCQIFGGSGGQGIYRYEKNGADHSIQLADIGWQATTLVDLVVGNAYLIAVQGTYAHEGMRRPFVGEIVVQTGRCFTHHYPGSSNFSWNGSITLL